MRSRPAHPSIKGPQPAIVLPGEMLALTKLIRTGPLLSRGATGGVGSAGFDGAVLGPAQAAITSVAATAQAAENGGTHAVDAPVLPWDSTSFANRVAISLVTYA